MRFLVYSQLVKVTSRFQIAIVAFLSQLSALLLLTVRVCSMECGQAWCLSWGFIREVRFQEERWQKTFLLGCKERLGWLVVVKRVKVDAEAVKCLIFRILETKHLLPHFSLNWMLTSVSIADMLSNFPLQFSAMLSIMAFLEAIVIVTRSDLFAIELMY